MLSRWLRNFGKSPFILGLWESKRILRGFEKVMLFLYYVLKTAMLFRNLCNRVRLAFSYLHNRLRKDDLVLHMPGHSLSAMLQLAKVNGTSAGHHRYTCQAHPGRGSLL